MVELGTLALIQYNKLTRCLLLNRPEPSFVTFGSHGKPNAAVRRSVVVIRGGYRTSAYVFGYDLVEFLSYL